MQIRFSFETVYGTYSDALNLPDDHTYTEQEIEAMKQEHLATWLAAIEATIAEQLAAAADPVAEQPPV